MAKEKKPKREPKYAIVDYLTLHQYVLDYQANLPLASDNLINSFRGFILKFVHLIKHGVYKISDYSLRQFISLFIPKEDKLFEPNNNIQYNKKRNIQNKFECHSKKIMEIFGYCTELEIEHELICVLLGMANKYKDYDRPSFHNYVSKCFHFEAFRGLSPLITKSLFLDDSVLEYDDHINTKENINKFLMIEEESIINADYDIMLLNAKIPIVISNSSPYDSESINDNWINGVTCTDTFNCLTQFERSLIKLHYIDKMRDADIAYKYGLCRAVINRRRLIAERKLSANIKFK